MSRGLSVFLLLEAEFSSFLRSVLLSSRGEDSAVWCRCGVCVTECLCKCLDSQTVKASLLLWGFNRAEITDGDPRS